MKSKYADKHGKNIVIQRNQRKLFLSFVLYGEFMVFNATFNNISVISWVFFMKINTDKWKINFRFLVNSSNYLSFFLTRSGLSGFNVFILSDQKYANICLPDN